MTRSTNAGDAAMLDWLAGDEHVIATAGRIWDATGEITQASTRLATAQDELHAATDAYAVAIASCRIPPEHAERLGAALIYRLSTGRLAAKLDRLWPGGEQP